jgi:hypothetical protein
MTHSAAQQVLLQRLGIATLQLHAQFSSVSAFSDPEPVIDQPVELTDTQILPDSGFLRDLLLVLQSLETHLQPVTHNQAKHAVVSEQLLVLPWPLNAADKRQLWQLLSSLDPS